MASAQSSVRRRSKWRPALAIAVVYLLTAALTGAFVYQWVPTQYLDDENQDWSWPPTTESLGLRHGRWLAIARESKAERPESAAISRQMVHEEQTAYFRRWLTVTLVGLIPIILLTLAWTILRRPGSKDERRRFGKESGG